MNHVITKGYANPPYHVEHFPIGSCVCNSTGFNCLSFTDKPGAKFTSAELAESICEEWNKEQTK